MSFPLSHSLPFPQAIPNLTLKISFALFLTSHMKSRSMYPRLNISSVSFTLKVVVHVSIVEYSIVWLILFITLLLMDIWIASNFFLVGGHQRFIG